jgi:membrane protease YdiL (CAAX protease family)
MGVSHAAAPAADPGAAADVDPTGPASPYPTHRKVWECAAAITGVGLIVFALPLGSSGYLALCVAASATALAYAAYGVWRVPGTPRRWGLIGNPRRAEGIARGFGWAFLMTAAGVVPVAVGRGLVTHPPLAFPPLYSLWCIVQDFVFFSLLLRNLLDHMPKWAAVALAAAMFALTHYPFGEMMAVTAGAALVWGYIFATSRVLWFVFLPHLLLGYVLLS